MRSHPAPAWVNTNWVKANWPYAGLTASLFLLVLFPLLCRVWPPALLIVFLQLPLYMAHQVEEHHHDRFRTFMNDHLAQGRNALTTPAVVFINIVGVWCVDVAALYLACFVNPNYGLIAIYLALINSLFHIAVFVLLRVYNPGLITAVLLLLPASCTGVWILVHSSHPSLSDHLQTAGFVILFHLLLIVSFFHRLHQLNRGKP